MENMKFESIKLSVHSLIMISNFEQLFSSFLIFFHLLCSRPDIGGERLLQICQVVRIIGIFAACRITKSLWYNLFFCLYFKVLVLWVGNYFLKRDICLCCRVFIDYNLIHHLLWHLVGTPAILFSLAKRFWFLFLLRALLSVTLVWRTWLSTVTIGFLFAPSRFCRLLLSYQYIWQLAWRMSIFEFTTFEKYWQVLLYYFS